MDVLFVPDYSGGNPYQRELAAALERRGVDVDLALPGVYKLPFARAVADHGRPDVLHLHWVYPFLVGEYRWVTVLKGTRLLVSLLLLKLLGVRVVWTVHNLLDHEKRTPGVERRFRHLVARLCDALVVHCPSARDRVVEAYDLPAAVRDRVAVVPHGHYVDSYPDDVPRTAARRDLDLDPGTTAFLYFGRIREYKNVPGLVAAFEALDRPDAELLVVGRPGDDALDERLGAQCAAADRVRYVPEFVPEEEVQNYMNAADAVVLPFADVLSSGSAVLAMSFGNPVVAPRIGCVGSLLADQRELTYDPDAPDGLERALEAALAADLEAIGRRNRERMEACHDWETVAAETHRVYAGG